MPNSDHDFIQPDDVDRLIMINREIKSARDRLCLQLTDTTPTPAKWSDFDACREEVIPTVLGCLMTRSDCLTLAKQLGSRLLIIDVARDNTFDADRHPPLTLSYVEEFAAHHGLLDLRPPKYNKQNSSFRFADSAA